ncbi:solute carrier family 66 member 3 isoform X2 [Prinia subflava]|uniref:solute carrier family 66 member 3 isoform X2 n=1 Tax=Prinia subflava TaxID=208062 RepID=UPI002FE04EC9
MSLRRAAAEGASLCLGYSMAPVPCGAGSCTRQTDFPHPKHYLVFLRYQIYYGYPLETYLEYPIIIAQDVILIFCIMHFNGKVKRAFFYAAIYCGSWYMLTLQKCIIDMAMNLCTFVSAASKLVQLQHLWHTKDSGQASALTWGMAVYTCAARIITTVMTTNDPAVLTRFIIMLILNIWVTATVLYYRKTKKTD